MKLEIVINKFLIEVVKQLESLRINYKKFHKYEIPIFNPIENGLRDVSKQLISAISNDTSTVCKLEKLPVICLKGSYDSSREAGTKYKSSTIERAKMTREVTGVEPSVVCCACGYENDNNSGEQII
mgnify:CR=1 FL=1